MLGHLVSFSLILLVFVTGARAEVNGAGRYNADGPYAVTTAVLAVPLPNGAITTTAYIPKAPRPHPVVIFFVGLYAKEHRLCALCQASCQLGHHRVLQDDPAIADAPAKARFPDEASADEIRRSQRLRSRLSPIEASTWLAEINADAKSPLHGIIDASRVGLPGHSRGAQIALLAARTCRVGSEGCSGSIRSICRSAPPKRVQSWPISACQWRLSGRRSTSSPALLPGSTNKRFTMRRLLPPWPSQR